MIYWQGKRYDIESLSIDRILIKEHFMKKSCRKYAWKATCEKLFWKGVVKNLFKLFFFWKMGLELMASHSSGSQNFLISYKLSDQVWWWNIKRFLSHSKIYTNKFMPVKSWHWKLFHLHLPFWIWKVWNKGEKLQKFEYLENKKSFLD